MPETFFDLLKILKLLKTSYEYIHLLLSFTFPPLDKEEYVNSLLASNSAHAPVHHPAL